MTALMTLPWRLNSRSKTLPKSAQQLTPIRLCAAITAELAEVGTRLKVKMLRQEWDAVVVEDSPFDPANARIRVDG